MRLIFPVFASLFISIPVYGFDACNIDRVVNSFANGLVSDCDGEFDVAFKQLVYVSDLDADMSGIKPRIRDTDIQVHAHVMGCGIDDDYYFFIRDSGSDAEVISYTSFSQPE